MNLLSVLAVLGAASLFAACGPGASSGQPTAPPAAQKPIDVQVSLSEFKVEPSLTGFKIGSPYRFVVTNKGTVNHDFAISPPMMQGMAGHGSSEDTALVVIKAEDMPPGTTKTVEYTFTGPSTADAPLEFACHVAGHYEGGMHTPITVTQ